MVPPRISQLAYVGFRVADLNEWRSFGTDLLGLEVASSDGDEDVLRLRMDERASGLNSLETSRSR